MYSHPLLTASGGSFFYNFPASPYILPLKLDLRTYSQRVFSMYRGRKARIKLRFIPPLLDTMIERFGTGNAQYGKPDDRHYTVETEVEVSDQFYGWLLGFGKRVKLMYPAEEQEKFLAYVDKIRDAY